MKSLAAEHLSKHKRIQQGSYYTPEKLVARVHQLISPYLQAKGKDAVVFDSAGGYGVFLADKGHLDYRIAELDPEAYERLIGQFDRNRVFLTNSLVRPDRGRYLVPTDAFLIMIGNPPYNDITSEFKKGEKGKNLSDPELFDRDLGISFLKSYEKLAADVVCILHPLAYLIKEANFKRLREFKNKYKLIKGEIFSSEYFFGTGLTKFPILIALYERNENGMTFDYIRNFQFDMLDNDTKFVLTNYETTDSHIIKYPPGRKDVKISPIGLYYYTFRDFNSLKRNASFITKQVQNAIVVTVENFYKYAYLYSLKKLFNPEEAWLYGNLSPLRLGDIEKRRELYMSYALRSHNVLKGLNEQIRARLLEHCGETRDEPWSLKALEAYIKEIFQIEFERHLTEKGKGEIGVPAKMAANKTSRKNTPVRRKAKEEQQMSIQFAEK